MESSFDIELAKIWNDKHPNEQIAPEHFWDICRELCSHDVLQANRGAVSTMQIGPFHIAAKLDVQRRSIVTFFVESVFPALITKVGNMTFSEAYPLYIIPAFKVLGGVLDRVYVIKSIYNWEILLYIKNANENGIYPTSVEVEEEWQRCGYPGSAGNALFDLCNKVNSLGTAGAIIEIDGEGRIRSLV